MSVLETASGQNLVASQAEDAAQHALQVWRLPDRARLWRDRVLVLIFILTLWEVLGRYLLDEIWVSRPSLIADRLWELVITGKLWLHAQRTLRACQEFCV